MQLPPLPSCKAGSSRFASAKAQKGRVPDIKDAMQQVLDVFQLLGPEDDDGAYVWNPTLARTTSPFPTQEEIRCGRSVWANADEGIHAADKSEWRPSEAGGGDQPPGQGAGSSGALSVRIIAGRWGTSLDDEEVCVAEAEPWIQCRELHRSTCRVSIGVVKQLPGIRFVDDAIA